jgi:hypothetical protein
VPYCHLHFFLWVFHQTTIQCGYAKTLHVVCEGPSLCHNIGGGSDVSSPNPMDHPAHDHSQHHTAFNYWPKETSSMTCCIVVFPLQISNMQKLPREYYALGWKLLPKLVENSSNNGMDPDRKGCSLTVWSCLNRKSRNSAWRAYWASEWCKSNTDRTGCSWLKILEQKKIGILQQRLRTL